MKALPAAARLVAAARAMLVSLWLACAGAAAAEPGGFRPFEFALLGDPQIGFGQGGEYADTARFARVIDSLNGLDLPLVVIPGDLVQDRSLWQHWLFDWQLGRLKHRVALTPGNHDVVDTASLAAYRKRHGPDHGDLVLNDCAFVFVNSETARDATLSAYEHDAQWSDLERRLAAHRSAGRKHVLLVTHRPPFVNDESEPASNANWPPPTRGRLLSLARQHGVRWILSGHLHRTHVARTGDGLEIVVVAGSARSFDRSPVDYRIFQVGADGLSHRRVGVAPPTTEPFSMPGLRGWTPRLFDFSPRHWLFTVLYVVAGLAALRAARAQAQPAAAAGWRTVGFLLIAFGANMQLDLDELLQELGRLFARVAGWYPLRHALTAALLAALALLATLTLRRHWQRSPGHRPLTWAFAALTVPTAWFCLSAASHHDIGMLFDEAWWDLLVLAALATIGLNARRARRVHNAGRTPVAR